MEIFSSQAFLKILKNFLKKLNPRLKRFALKFFLQPRV
jgi:hypothetical protein